MEDDNSMNEPLNLCKKKKPVAIVAPSSVVGEEDAKEVEEHKEAESSEEGRSEPSKTDAYHNVYSMIRSLAQSEQNLLTAMYMGGLMHSGLIAGRSGNPPLLNPYGLWTPPDQPPSSPEQTSSSKKLSLNVPKIDLNLPQVPLSLNIPNLKSMSSHSSKPPEKPAKPNAKWSSSMDHKSSSSTNDGPKSQESGHTSSNQEKKKPHIKKPLNAFMLYMKEMRAKVVAECTLKESAAINQILGRRWHSLSREEQAKYYEKARIERQLHMELYPGWSARDNYGYGAKKKKRKKERVTITDPGGNSMKKCRARYGLDQQSQWCKPCRRKKKCIRYSQDDGTQESEDNLGSCGSVGDTHSPEDDDVESYHHSSSSPGGLSALSSLTSPSMILPSPSASLASPSVSLASPCMSLQSPLTPHALDYETKPSLPLLSNHIPVRNPVGTNPHDINNPLSVNQLTGKCIKNSSSNSSPSPASSGKEASRTVISVP
ncbi:hypothetical protein GE061_016804 [Apolygus lucorum]|uniref:dTCF n=1 Tax=Apolygus lucorum TaxID=248454 RepID=A0A6A4K1E2_APOLU|nr:hypothetical protein GE061_016804 [Apolygus lucorum]